MKKFGCVLISIIIITCMLCVACHAESVVTTPGYSEKDDTGIWGYISLADKNDPLTELSLKKGDKKKIKATPCNYPSELSISDISWSSSNPDTVSINGKGTLKALGEGSSEISCKITLSDGYEIISSVPVNVIIPVKKIKAPDKIKLDSNTYNIFPQVSPENATKKAVKYESSDPFVAKVDKNGNVTAVSAGTCIITTTATDGSDVYAKTKVVVPTFYDTSNQYSISSKDGIDITWGCFSKAFATINGKIDNSSICSLDMQYDSTAHKLYMHIKPLAKGKTTITITDTNSGVKSKFKVSVDKAAVSGYSGSADIYDEDKTLLDIKGFKIINKGDPEFGEYYDGSLYLTVNFLAENSSNRDLAFSDDSIYINGWKASAYAYVSIGSGTKGYFDVTISDLQKSGIYKLSDIKEIIVNGHIYDTDSYNTVVRKANFKLSYNPSLVHKSDFNKSIYPDIPYKDLMRNPDNYIGKKYSFKGKVLQATKQSGMNVYRVSTSGSYDNVVFVCILEDSDIKTKLIEDDKVSVSGTFFGLETYTAVLGNEITIPVIVADNIILK